MNAYDSIIFDLDGTLWSTVEICTSAWKDILRSEKRKEITIADMGSTMGLTAEEIRKKFFADLSKDEGERLLARCFDQEVSLLKKDGGTLYPFVAEGIKELSKHFQLFVVSNCEVAYMDVFLATSGLKGYFKGWECHGATRLSKGDNALEIMRRNIISRPIFIGDTNGDQVAASHAEIPFAFVAYGFGTCTQYDFKFDSFHELTTTFLNMVSK